MQHHKVEDSANPQVIVIKLAKSGIDAELNVPFIDVAQIWTNAQALEAIRYIPCESIVGISSELFEEFRLPAEDSFKSLETIPVVFRGEIGKRWKEAYDKRFEEGIEFKTVRRKWPEIQESKSSHRIHVMASHILNILVSVDVLPKPQDVEIAAKRPIKPRMNKKASRPAAPVAVKVLAEIAVPAPVIESVTVPNTYARIVSQGVSIDTAIQSLGIPEALAVARKHNSAPRNSYVCAKLSF